VAQFATSAFSFVGAWMRLPRSIATPMLESVMMTLGVFLVLAARNPPAYRSLILYGGWANLAHATVMALMAMEVRTGAERGSGNEDGRSGLLDSYLAAK
jgi:hypothetical protein